MLPFQKRPAIIFVPVLICALFCSCANSAVILPEWVTKTADTGDDGSWTVPEGDAVVLSNGTIKLEMQTETTHFTLTDLTTGKKYTSVPDYGGEIFSDETKARIASEISLVYYDSNSAAQFMSSTKDSVENGSYVIRQKDDTTLRVYYTMGATVDLVVPLVFTKDVFEEVICKEGGLSSNQIRRIKRYYDLYTSSDKEATEDYDKKLSLYPALAKKDLYILKDTVDKLKKIEISDYMKTLGYTAKQYTAHLNELGIQQGKSSEAGFTVPVEYSLTKDGFTAKILMDKVKEYCDKFPLYRIDLLEYFASFGKEAKGYYLVPDGCGALIQMNQKKGEYSQKFYGNDAAIQSPSKTQLAKSAPLPVFGMTSGDAGMLGMVEAGAEIAALHVATISDSNPQNTIYTSFEVRALDKTEIGKDRNIPVFNLYGKHLLRVSPLIRYSLLPQAKANYVGMAAYTRQYYMDNKKLPEKQTPDSGIFLDYLCLATKKVSILGVPYTQRLVLSTLSQITSQLSSCGISGVSVRLSGYSNDGITHGVNSSFQLSAKVGTADQLKTLNSYLQKQKGRLYLEADFQHTYQDTPGDGFSAKADTAQYLNRSLILDNSYDRVTRTYYNSVLSSYLISPALYADLSHSFLTSLGEKLGEQSAVGIGYGPAGSLLSGDYSRKRDLDRTASLRFIKESVAAAQRQGYTVAAEYGNDYILPYVSQLINVPLFSSNFDIASETVPFYQLVVHGSVPYTGTAMNLSVNSGTNLLRSLEYGAGLYWQLMAAEDYELSETPYASTLYSLNAASNLKNVSSLSAELKDYFQSINGAAMTNHEQLAKQVYKTTYASGSWVIVNYNENDYVANGTTIPGRGYKVWHP